MTRKPIILAGICAVLLAAPAFAQSSDTSPSNQTNHVSGAAPASDPADAKDPSVPYSGGGATHNIGMPVTQSPDRKSQDPAMGSQGSAQMVQKKASRHPMASNGQPKQNMAQQNMAQRKQKMASKSRSCYDFAWQSKDMNDCLARNPQQAQSAQSGNMPANKAPSSEQRYPNGPNGPTQ